jgi:hypothetical protein
VFFLVVGYTMFAGFVAVFFWPQNISVKVFYEGVLKKTLAIFLGFRAPARDERWGGAGGLGGCGGAGFSARSPSASSPPPFYVRCCVYLSFFIIPLSAYCWLAAFYRGLWGIIVRIIRKLSVNH